MEVILRFIFVIAILLSIKEVSESVSNLLYNPTIKHKLEVVKFILISALLLVGYSIVPK